MTIGEIAGYLSSEISLALQEDYDNSGLQVGDVSKEIDSVILTVDITEETVEEAIETGAGMIISHHPVIFNGLKKITGADYVERIVERAIKSDIALYSAHTNLDVIEGGVSYRMAEKLGIKNLRPLSELKNRLLKIVVFVPEESVSIVKKTMFEAGAGTTGNYDHCSFSVPGRGAFRAGVGARPYKGVIDEDHTEDELRIEMIMPDYLKDDVVSALLAVHPYEEVAYDIYRLENSMPRTGLGCYGELDKPLEASEFLKRVAGKFDARGIRYSGSAEKRVKKVALCGGSGSSLIDNANRIGADIFLTADIKYHSFFEASGGMIIADIGHHESEKFSLEILYEFITKKFPKFAVRFSKCNTNPINYL